MSLGALSQSKLRGGALVWECLSLLSQSCAGPSTNDNEKYNQCNLFFSLLLFQKFSVEPLRSLALFFHNTRR